MMYIHTYILSVCLLDLTHWTQLCMMYIHTYILSVCLLDLTHWTQLCMMYIHTYILSVCLLDLTHWTQLCMMYIHTYILSVCFSVRPDTLDIFMSVHVFVCLLDQDPAMSVCTLCLFVC